MSATMAAPIEVHPTRPALAEAVDWTVVTDLGSWASAWDELVEHSPLASPFLRTWWLEGAGERPYFVLVTQGARLIGGLALDRKRVAGVDLLTVLTGGKLCPDHLDLLAAPGRECDVIAAIRAWFASPGARVLDLDGLAEDALLVDALADAGPAQVEVVAAAPYEPLLTVEDYYRPRSSFAKRVRRRRRQLERRGVTVRRALVEESGAVLASFLELQATRPDREEFLRHWPRLARALELGLARGEVRLDVAEQDGRCGGVLITFTTGRRLRVYQGARSLDSDFRDVGTVLDASMIEDGCGQGYAEVDFLRGDEPYKASFAAHRRQLLRLRTARGVRGRLLLGALLAVTGLRARAAARLSAPGAA